MNKRNHGGWTALHRASSSNDTDVIWMLLQHGATRDIKDADGDTPTDVARKQNRQEAFHVLQQY